MVYNLFKIKIIITRKRQFLDGIQYTCGDTFYNLASFTNIQDSNGTNDSMERLFSIVKINNALTCNSPIKVSYYSSDNLKRRFVLIVVLNVKKI